MPTGWFTRVLFYAGPLLVNGALWLLYVLKERYSHYTMIAEGLGFLLGLLLGSVVLNGALSLWMARQHAYLLAGGYGAVALAIVILLALIRFKG